MGFKIKFLDEMLKEKSGEKFRYSQGRVYLFTAFFLYFNLLVTATLGDMNLVPKVDVEFFNLLSNSLQWIIALLAGYVFGGKTLETVKNLSLSKKNISAEIKTKSEDV